MPETPPAKRRVSQAPIKLTACFGGCGAAVEYRTTPRVYCAKCRIKRHRASSAVSVEKQRRKRGIPKIKGTSIPCATCGRPVVLNRNARAKFCPACADLDHRKRARRSSKAKRSTEAGRRYLNEWGRARRKTDPAWGLNASMRVLMHRAIGKTKAGRSWETLVPYALPDLMRHLERQFRKGMSWENRGRRWHIDHIIPLASFTFTSPDDPDFKAAWALSNLRPLWKRANLEKNAKRTLIL